MKNAGLQWLPFFALLLATSAMCGDELPQLKAKPNKCIALNKGQECYQTVKFRINVADSVEYCLVKTEDGQPLHCWLADTSVVFTYEFVATETQVYYLREESSKKIVTETQVSVAWVYKSTKKPAGGWRLF